MSDMRIDSLNIAAIDIGSNAARLLVKHVDIDIDGNQKLRKSLFLRVPLRLGMDVFNDGKLSDRRAYEFLHTMKAYRQLMKVYDVNIYRACATSAMRDAKNGKEVLKSIEKGAGIKIEIISGDEESQMVYDNHYSLMSGEGNFLYVDVGISNGERLYSHSFNVGTIRLLNNKVKPNVLVEMKQTIGEVTKGYDNIVIIGSGGNINKLYRLANKREKTKEYLPVDVLRRLYERLNKMSVEERMQLFNLKPDRADVIVPAAEIFLHVASSAHVEKIMVPNIGLADGIINDLLRVYVSKKR